MLHVQPISNSAYGLVILARLGPRPAVSNVLPLSTKSLSAPSDPHHYSVGKVLPLIQIYRQLVEALTRKCDTYLTRDTGSKIAEP